MFWSMVFWARLTMVQVVLLVVWGEEGVLGSPLVSSMFVNNTDFCSRILLERSVGTCPRPPTMDNLNVDMILGSYYEVGSTVGYKLRNDQLATACGHTNFSIKEPQYNDNENVFFIDIQSSSIPILQGPLHALRHALHRVAFSSSSACSHVAHMCAITANLSDISDRIATVVLSSGYNDVDPTTSSGLQNASMTIKASVANVHRHLDRIANAIGSLVAGIWIALTQVNDGSNSDATRTTQSLLIPATRLHIDIAVGEVRKLESFVDNLAYVARLLDGLDSPDGFPLYHALHQASSIINNGVNEAISQVC